MHKIFTVTTLELENLTYGLKDKGELTGETATILTTKRSRIVGWYPELKDAKLIPELNCGDVYEVGHYPWIVIEEVEPGLYPDIINELWFKWEGDVETGIYKPTDKPKEFDSVVNFGIG